MVVILGDLRHGLVVVILMPAANSRSYTPLMHLLFRLRPIRAHHSLERRLTGHTLHAFIERQKLLILPVRDLVWCHNPLPVSVLGIH